MQHAKKPFPSVLWFTWRFKFYDSSISRLLPTPRTNILFLSLTCTTGLIQLCMVYDAVTAISFFKESTCFLIETLSACKSQSILSFTLFESLTENTLFHFSSSDWDDEKLIVESYGSLFLAYLLVTVVDFWESVLVCVWTSKLLEVILFCSFQEFYFSWEAAVFISVWTSIF